MNAAAAPLAPSAPGRLPWAGNGLAFLRDPNAYLARLREHLGDTFETEIFGRRVLWVFSPAGVRNLWALPEPAASKGAADVELLRMKVPDTLFAGRRTIPHALFARDDVERYVDDVRIAVERECDELPGTRGELEAFAWTRRLGHRIGIASWAGHEASEARFFDRLVPAFDRLDSSESFVHPERAFWTWLTGKRRERAALEELDAVLGEVIAAREAKADERDDFLAQVLTSWEGVAEPERRTGIARDVVLVHMASMSNLFAALGWVLVHLVERPDLLERVRKNEPGLLERCTQESIRLMQRSVVLRRVLKPTEIADESKTYPLEPGTFVATLMTLTNQSAAPGLDTYDPDHWAGRRFRDRKALATPELVTTFGHGAHSCPAQSYALQTIRIAVEGLLERFELEPRFDAPRALKHQIGGVARADRPCPIAYRKRAAR